MAGVAECDVGEFDVGSGVGAEGLGLGFDDLGFLLFGFVWTETQYAVCGCDGLRDVRSETEELAGGLAALDDCDVDDEEVGRLVFSGREELAAVPVDFC